MMIDPLACAVVRAPRWLNLSTAKSLTMGLFIAFVGQAVFFKSARADALPPRLTLNSSTQFPAQSAPTLADRCARIRALPNPATPNSISCDSDGRVNSAPAIARDTAELATPITAALNTENEAVYQNYGNVCDIQNFAADAERLSKGVPWLGNCLRKVKSRIQMPGNRWLLDNPSRSLDEGVASKSPAEFESQGFVDILSTHPELRLDPMKAPLGAMLVYRHNDKPCPLPHLNRAQLRDKNRRLSLCEAINIGHIEIRTAHGFAHETLSDKPITEVESVGSYMELSAVLIKPLKMGPVDPKRGCITRL